MGPRSMVTISENRRLLGTVKKNRYVQDTGQKHHPVRHALCRTEAFSKIIFQAAHSRFDTACQAPTHVRLCMMANTHTEAAFGYHCDRSASHTLYGSQAPQTYEIFRQPLAFPNQDRHSSPQAFSWAKRPNTSCSHTNMYRSTALRNTVPAPRLRGTITGQGLNRTFSSCLFFRRFSPGCCQGALLDCVAPTPAGAVRLDRWEQPGYSVHTCVNCRGSSCARHAVRESMPMACVCDPAVEMHFVRV